jgi:protein-S-isoprenylcysteine O-methyltransferase Ste14
VGLAAHVWFALAWLSFGALHSVLASRSVKDSVGRRLGRGYRLAYNGFAVAHLGAVWLLGRHLFRNAPPLDLPGWLALAGDAAFVAGLVVLAVGMLEYDRGRFLGLTQLRSPDAAEDEPLRIGGLHRYVRHPLYSGAFLVLWGHAQSESGLATAAWGSLYLLIGTYFEERRLVALYGKAYSDYRKAVPAFVPWKGRAGS